VQYRFDGQTVVGRLRGIALQGRRHVAKVERLVTYEALPGYLHSAKRDEHASRRLYLVDELCRVIDPINFHGVVRVWLRDLPRPDQYDYEVGEILYRLNGRWKLRSIDRRHQLPCEYMAVPRPKLPTLPVKKLFLDLYYDDFGTFRNVYHSLGGVYMQVGNMPLTMRRQIRNHFLIGFVPFGATFNEFIRPVVEGHFLIVFFFFFFFCCFLSL
jgi:hypothetical protein